MTQVITFLAALAFGLHAAVGAFALRAQPRSPVNRLFASSCFCFAVWAAAFAFYIAAPTQEIAWYGYRVTVVGWTLAPALLLHFFLLLTERRPPAIIAYTGLYVPALVFFVKGVTGKLTIDGFLPSGMGWAVVAAGGVWVWAYTAYCVAFVTIGLVCVHQWASRSQVPVRAKQSRIIIWTGITAVGLSTLTNRLLPTLDIYVLPAVAPILLAIWTVGIWYAMSKYSLMMITPQVAAEEILATIADAVLLIGPDNRVITTNRAAERLLGMPQERLIGANVKEILPESHLSTTQVFRTLKYGDDHLTSEAVLQLGKVEEVPLQIASSTVRDMFGQALGVVMILRDISQQKQSEDKLRHQAHHDALTGLPNRALLHDRLIQAVARTRRYKQCAAVLLLDLDRFKEVNDTLGHDCGDILLRQVAERVPSCVRGCDTVARMGGDEFVVIAGELPDGQSAAAVAKRLLALFEAPFEIMSHSLHVTPSIGISVCPDDGQTGEELLRLADVAMYESKRRGHGQYTFFESSMLAHVEKRLTIESQLRTALDKQQFVLHYLPLYDLRTGILAGLEALLRWQHPTRGIVPPLEFLPVAESAGLMELIDTWVIRTACAAARAWSDMGLGNAPVSVNVSGRHLVQPALIETVRAALAEASLAPERLRFDIAEGVLTDDLDGAVRAIKALAGLGVRVSVDDSGMAYSSLLRVKDLPIEALKIDRYFVKSIDGDPTVAVMVMATIAVAHSLNIRVIAEGIETLEQLRALRALKPSQLQTAFCDLGQGFIFGKPVPADQVPEFLRAHSRIDLPV